MDHNLTNYLGLPDKIPSYENLNIESSSESHSGQTIPEYIMKQMRQARHFLDIPPRYNIPDKKNCLS